MQSPIDIGTRLELFVDEFLIDRMDGAHLKLHQPVPRDIALETDRPWEGNMCGYITVLRDGPVCRMYYNTNGWIRLREYTICGGEFVTKPFTFAGSHLTLNMSTSGAGSIRVGVLDANGVPVPGFALSDCNDIIGDELERTVSWRGGSNLSDVAGTPVRLRFALSNADLYAIRFAE